MRAIVLLCLLHAAFGQYGWDGPSTIATPTTKMPTRPDPDVCLLDQASCGCCLMQKQVERISWFFNLTYDTIKAELTDIKMMLDEVRASRAAFSVALNGGSSDCYSPLSVIVYNHVFINLGDSYNTQTGVFTVPHSGVYSLSVTIYADNTLTACANLQVNGQVVAALLEHNGQDHEDSATIVMAITLMAGDQVVVFVPQGCVVCDHKSHYNTFTGFLLYALY